ncbi:MAG: hypothetical protein LBC45_05045 [Chlamydiales bacterium]|jgi:hypothetical protein|nr:hypothetical protein [Chlamydiales bacterium]
MSVITSYERLPSEIPEEQPAHSSSWRRWHLFKVQIPWKELSKPQQDFVIGFAKMTTIQCVGFFVAGLLGEVSPLSDFARRNLSVTYYIACEQATASFLTATAVTGFFALCASIYFFKKNQETGNENISPNRQMAIQYQIEKEIQAQLARNEHFPKV